MTAPERPEFGPPSRCQHCPAPIWPTRAPLPGGAEGEVLWEDSAGVTQCLKAAVPPPVPMGSRLFHRPMPGGGQ